VAGVAANRRWIASYAALALVLGVASAAAAATVLVDAASGDVLEEAGGDTRVPLGRAADLLLITLVTDRAYGTGWTLATEVPLRAVVPDAGPALALQRRASVAELVQVLLLTRSGSAARSLAAAVGDDQVPVRLTRVCRALRLQATAVSADTTGTPSVFPAGISGTTSACDVARLTLALLRDGGIRRRIRLDGVPVAGGDVIVRATAPLIATRAPLEASARSGGAATAPTEPMVASPAAASDADGPAIALAERDDLELLAIATGPDAARVVWDVIERGFSRYRRMPVVAAGAKIAHAITVRGGILPAFHPKAAETFAVTARRGDAPTLALSLQLPVALEAPVDLNQRVGELVIERDGRVLGVVPLLAPMTIAPSRWLDTAARD